MNDVVVASKRMTLLELLDRLLGTGVVVDGKVLLSVADVDLVYVGLRMVLSSVATLEQHAGEQKPESHPSGEDQAEVFRPARRGLAYPSDSLPAPLDGCPTGPATEDSTGVNGHVTPTSEQASVGSRQAPDRLLDSLRPPVPTSQPAAHDTPAGRPRLDIDPEKVERGLAKLVLTIVELLRRLMESQAVRRMDQGTLTDEEIERLGQAFSLLEARMEDLKKVFGLEDEELNLDLGPIGKLL